MITRNRNNVTHNSKKIIVKVNIMIVKIILINVENVKREYQ